MQEKNAVLTGMKRAGAATVIGVLAATVLAFVLAIPLSSMGVGGAERLSWPVLVAAVLTAGAVSGRRNGSRGLLWGAVSGLMVFAAVMLIGLGLCASVDAAALYKALLCVLGGAVSGAAAVNLRAGRRRVGRAGTRRKYR